VATLVEAVYTFLFLAVASGYGTAEIMHLLKKGYHPILSGTIASVIGLLAVYLVPFSFVSAVIIPIITAIIADISLTKVLDKADEKISDAFDNAADRECHYILHGSDAEKRAKNLRLHTDKHHGITTTISAEQTIEILERAISEASFMSNYSDAKKEAYEGQSNSNIIQFSFSHAFIRLIIQKRDNDTRVTIWVNEEATNQMKWLDSLKYVKRIELAWDSIYIIAKNAILTIDPNAVIDFTRNK